MVAANDAIVVRDLAPAEIDAAVGVLARGMRDNPLHVAAYGADPERRRRRHARLMRGVFSVFDAMHVICAAYNGTVVGVAGWAPAGTCQPSHAQRVRILPAVTGLGPLTAARVVAWTSAWANRDPREPHVHLGPLAVDGIAPMTAAFMLSIACRTAFAAQSPSAIRLAFAFASRLESPTEPRPTTNDRDEPLPGSAG